MPEKNAMPKEARNKHLKNEQKIYQRATRKKKGEMLTLLEEVTTLKRKTLITKLGGDLENQPRRKQRGRSYGPEVDDALRVIWEAFDYISAERLTPNLVSMAQNLARHGELTVTPELLEQLGRISIATVGRILKRIRQDDFRLPRRGPKEANRARQAVPMERIPWDEPEPGHFEVDLVHHGGSSSKGDYVHTIQIIDVATGWSERVACLGRSYVVMENGFQYISQRLIFPVRELHPDNGSEFFNHHMLAFWPNCFPGLKLSRSRPWEKNDNRFVEQKNDTLVRQYFGDQRFDTVAQTQAMNELYDQMWFYYNFFQPVMRLKEKIVFTDQQGKKRMRRRFDTAQTPFERLCATGVLSSEEQARWCAYRDSVNPRQLRRTIYAQIDSLSRMPGAQAGVPVDVRDALIDLSRKGVGLAV
jgi:hypothetical protein